MKRDPQRPLRDPKKTRVNSKRPRRHEETQRDRWKRPYETLRYLRSIDPQRSSDILRDPKRQALIDPKRP